MADIEAMRYVERTISPASLVSRAEQKAIELQARITKEINALKRKDRLSEAKLGRFRTIAQECEAKRPDLFKGFGSAF